MTRVSHEVKRNGRVVQKYTGYLWKDLHSKIKIASGNIGKSNKF